jgi:hypothetical protein
MVSNTKSIIPTCQEVNEITSVPFSGPFQKTDIDTISNVDPVVRGLLGRKKILFELMYAMAVNGRSIYASHDYFAKKLGCTRRHVIRLMHELKSLGLVYWFGREYSTNVYCIALALLTNEAVRRLRDVFLCAQLAWFRRLLLAGVFMTMLQTPDLDTNVTQRNSNKNFYKNCNCTVTVYNCGVCKKSSQSSSVITKKRTVKRGSRVNVSKKTFESIAKQGLEFTVNARLELQGASDSIVIDAAHQYLRSYGSKEVDNPWRIFMGIVKRLCKERNHVWDSSTVSALRFQYSIEEDSEKSLEFTPSASDNAKNTTSKSRATGSGTRTTSDPDDDGWVYGTAPDGTPVRTRPYNGDYRPFSKRSVDLGEPARVTEREGVESPAEIKRKMADYVISPAYTEHCNTFGKEHVAAQVKRWIAIADYRQNPPEDATISGNGEYAKINEIMAEILVNIYGPGRQKSTSEQSKVDSNTNTPGSE